MTHTRIAIVTAISAFGSDRDTRPLCDALAAIGIACDHVAWDDPTVSWGRFDAAVLRSPWNYSEQRPAFIAWAQRVARATRLVNPAQVVTWNTDKRYLAELLASGLPVVASRFIAPDEAIDTLPDWDEFVIKPTVGAGSSGAARFTRVQREQALAHAGELQSQGAHLLLQPYLDGVERDGETALVYFNGRFSHAVRKAALLSADGSRRCSQSAPEVITACAADAAQCRLAEAVLGQAGQLLALQRPLAYARVDLLPSPAGPQLLELELTEPSVFLCASPGAAERMADAIATHLRGG
jgi:glutathione synthase/RimK-type ligase-like ATP-grasp enzyme